MTHRNLLLGTALAALVPAGVHAQTAPASIEVADEDQADSAASGMQDIVVTARRREERLQDIPVAISAMTGGQLATAGISESRDLTLVTPSLVFSKANASFQPYIRGVGTRNANVGDESSVSVYVDGIYQPVMASVGMDLLKVERIEVLRGPQGTLFGRNSAGGLINIITPDPKFSGEGEMAVEYGNYGQRAVRFYATTGLSDVLAIAVNSLYKADDGYLRDLVMDERAGELNSKALRAKLLWQPSESFDAVVTAGISRLTDGYSLMNQPYKGNTIALRPPAPPILATKPWTTALGRELVGTANQEYVNLKLALRRDSVVIESVSSLQSNFAESNTDQDATTEPFTEVISPAKSRYFSQELRAISSLSGMFNYVAGLYYIKGRGRFVPATIVSNNAVVSNLFSEQNIESWAAFGEANFDFTPRLQLTVGFRYTEENRDYAATNFRGNGQIIAVLPKRKTSFSEPTYRAALLFKATDDINLYTSYSRGFKSGVFNGFAATEAAATPTRPEILDAFEGGVKADLADWLRVNVSAFYYIYKDQQLSALLPGQSVSVLFNAAKSKMNGGEIEATLTPIERLTLRLTGSYLDAKYDSFPGAQVFRPSGIGGNAAFTIDASGFDMIRAPEYTLSANFDYRIPSSVGDFSVSGNVYRSAKYYWEATNRLVQPAYTLVNAELAWQPQESVRLSIWGRNLTDEVVYRQLTLDANADMAAFDAPRSYGGRIVFSF